MSEFRGNRGVMSRPFYRSPAMKKGKCTSCISRGTISRSSLESRIRFLPSSMLAIPALWSPPGIAAAGTPDIPPANVPIPVMFVGIVAVCVFPYRFVPYFFFSFSHVRSIFSDSTFFFGYFYACTQISGFYSRIHSFPVRRRASTTSVSVSAFPRHFPIETFFVC